MRFREVFRMAGSSWELLLMFAALVFISTIAFRVAQDAIDELETAIGKFL